MKAIARVGDNIEGSCTGTYDVWETVGHTSKGKAIKDWVTYTETGYVTGNIETGSSITFDQGKAIARVGDTVRIYKHYNHSNHNDSLEITGVISTGSNIVFDQGKGVAYVGSEVNASNCNITISSGSDITFVYK